MNPKRIVGHNGFAILDLDHPDLEFYVGLIISYKLDPLSDKFEANNQKSVGHIESAILDFKKFRALFLNYHNNCKNPPSNKFYARNVAEKSFYKKIVGHIGFARLNLEHLRIVFSATH